MKCINCGTKFTAPRWPASYRGQRRIAAYTGQKMPGHSGAGGTFTCSLACMHVIHSIGNAIWRALRFGATR